MKPLRPKSSPQRTLPISLFFFFAALLSQTTAQSPPPQQLVFAGLRAVQQKGQINAVQADSAGNLYLLLDQRDGIRLLKTDNAANNILAQTLLGGPGDIGVALSMDPSGNLFVTGTTSSGALQGTSGAAFRARTDASINSFLAGFDSNLNPIFVTFTGGSRIAASALAATADAVFVTGITYASNLPVTVNGIQQSPAIGSVQNGFVEKFSPDGSTLLYATYLTGALGDTTPTAIAADPAGDAWIAGSTSASGFPTIAALVPENLSNPSGFLTRLSPAGDAFRASTFIPGPGLTSLALDSTSQTLLASGAVSLGQFPVDTVTAPLVPAIYQVLLRLPLDLSSVTSSTLLVPGEQSFIAAAPDGIAWVDGTVTLPLFPLPALADVGDGFAVRVSASGTPDQAARFGGTAAENPSYASLPTVITAIAVDPAGQAIIAGAVQPTASSSLLSTQTYDLPLRNTPTPALPSMLADAELSASTCTGSLCAGSTAYLAKLNPNASASSLSFSSADLPLVTLRNLGSATAENLQLSAPAATLSANCPSRLAPGAECNILLTGTSSTTLSATTSNGYSQSLSIASLPATASTIAFYPRELDFGIQTSTSPPATRTLTITNLGATAQTFASKPDAIAGFASPFTELSSDCPNTGMITTKTLAAGATCHITLALIAPSNPSSDGVLRSNWLVGARDVLLTGYSQAASLSLSASEIDFGTQFSNGIRLPRFLYLSNASTNTLTHAALTTPTNSPFTITDGCPQTLLPATVCRIRIDYLAASAPSTDSSTLTLGSDPAQTLSVLITAKTLPPPRVTGASVNPNLSVTPTSISFATAVPVTGVSAATQTVAITNTGSSPFSLAVALTGDFLQTSSCGDTLAGGATCAVALSFAPTQPGARQGLLFITAGGGTSPAYVTLNATASAILPANNGSFDFGAIPVSQPVVQFYRVEQPFNILTATTTGPYTVALIEDAGFGHGQPPSTAFASSTSGSCPNCFLALRFQPTAFGPQPGTLTLRSTPSGSPYTLTLTGSGLSLTGLVLTPLNQDFGSAPVHSTSGTTLFTLTNLSASSSSVALSSPALSGDFVLLSSTCPATLAYTASCAISVAFQPTATGVRSGSLTIASPTQTVSANLTGLGAPDPGVAISPLALTFTNIPGPTATQQTVTLTSTSSAAVQVGTPNTSTASFTASSQCAQLLPATSCSITVTFQPFTASTTGTLSIPTTSDSQTSTYTVALSGDYTSATAGLAIFPALAEYGPSPVFTQTSARQFTVTNLTVKSLALTIDIPRQFVLVGPPCTALAASAACTFSVAFLPLTNGDISGTITISATPSDGSLSLTSLAYVEGYGRGSGSLTLSGGVIVEGTYSFGQVTSGQSLAQKFTLTNPTSTPINIRRITSAPPFLSSTTCTSPLNPLQSCAVTITYTPSNQVASGTVSPSSTTDAGTLTIESDAASSPTILNLSGLAGPLSASSPADSTPLATFTLSQGSLTFPGTQVGNASAPQTVTFTNTGTVALHVLSLLVPADFQVQSTCASVVPQSSCTLTVTSTPTTVGTHIGALEVLTDSATSLDFISLLSSASAPTLTFTPGALLFGPVPINTSATLPIQVTNTGSTSATFNALLLTGDYSASGTCPLGGGLLAPNASCTIQVKFSPTATGVRSGTLSVVTSASTYPLLIQLTGTGTQSQLTVTPSSLSFGNVAVGSASTLSLTLLNTGTAAVTSLALTITGDYTFAQSCGPNLAPGTTCSVQITFTPTALGPRPGILTLTSSDPGSPAAIPLAGNGIQGGGVTLTVDGGSSASVTVVSGRPASYDLLLTPSGGFTGTVALTCSPIAPAPYATCSLFPASLTITGTVPIPATATINTITSTGGNVGHLLHPASNLVRPFACLLLPGLLILWRDRRALHRHRPLLFALIFAALELTLSGCSGGRDPNLRYTPAGVYQYQVTASSTTGVQLTQTVTLNLTVTAN